MSRWESPEPLEMLPSGRRQLHLVGFMGSGKSTVGRLLARELVWNFLDLDGLICRHAEMTVPEIFDDLGEPGFRKIEAHVFRQASRKPRAVVALGGGTFIDPDNRVISSEVATTVWLRCGFDVVRNRLGPRSFAGRPMWKDEDSARRLLADRDETYALADITLDAEGEPESVAAAVLSALGIDR